MTPDRGQQVEQLLASHEPAGSFLETPPIEPQETLVPNPPGDNLAASLNAGMAAAFPAGAAVVMGLFGDNYSSSGTTIRIPVVKPEAWRRR